MADPQSGSKQPKPGGAGIGIGIARSGPGAADVRAPLKINDSADLAVLAGLTLTWYIMSSFTVVSSKQILTGCPGRALGLSAAQFIV